jgi:hypothetical protein
MTVDQHVMRAGAAHAERAPGIEHLDLRRVHRNTEMQHNGPVLAVENGPGHQDVARRRAGGEDLAGGDAVTAFDLLRLAGAADPVRSAARQEHDPLPGHTLQQRLDGSNLLVTPAPCRDCHLMGVHREGETGRAALVRQYAQHRCEVADLGPAAAKLSRHADLDETCFFQQSDVVGDVGVFILVQLGAAGQFRAESACDLCGAARRRTGDGRGRCDCHG